MPIINPITQAANYPATGVFETLDTLNALLGQKQTVAATFSDSTTLAASLGQKKNVNAVFASSDVLTMDLVTTTQVEALFSSSDAMLANLRLNDEPNQFPAALFSDSTSLAVAPRYLLDISALFVNADVMTADLTVDVQPDFGFTFLVDVTDSAVAAAQAGQVRRYTARLLADGLEVKIRRAELTASQDTLGTEVSITLAKPLVSQITLAQSLTFQIGLWVSGAWSWITMVDGGKMSSRQNSIKNNESLPTDEVVVQVIDPVADRWNRAPRAPIYLYDPNTVDTPDPSDIADQRIQLPDGGYISQVNVGIFGMRIRDVLNRAYVTGCGFSSVVTNIQNFQVSEATFTLDGGFDAGVRPLLSLFAPVFFERSNILYIIDPDAPLPVGFSPRELQQSVIREISDSLQQREPVNAILVKMRSLSTGGDFSTERLDQDNQESGQFGTPAFTQTDITRRIREWRNTLEPLVIIREEEVSEEVSVTDWEFNLLEQSTTTKHFDVMGRLTGYSKRVDKRLPDINNDGAMTLLTDVVREEQSIVYKPNPLNPQEDVQDRVTTVQSGLVLVDDGFDYLGDPYRIPLTDAHASGYIDPSGDQHTETADIKTTVEQLMVRGQQVDVEIRVTNHLAKSTTRSTTTSRPGTTSIDRRSQAANRTMLVTVDGTDLNGRRAQVFDGGDLPADVALDLARRRLSRLNDPPREVQVTPAYVDLAVRRGTVLAVKQRANVALGNYIVLGFSVTVEAYTKEQGIQATMVVNARELKP